MFPKLSLCVNGQEFEYPFSVNTCDSANTAKLMNPETYMNPEKSPLV